MHCALIASSRTRFQISSTFSTNAARARETCGSLLSSSTSTSALTCARPRRHDHHAMREVAPLRARRGSRRSRSSACAARCRAARPASGCASARRARRTARPSAGSSARRRACARAPRAASCRRRAATDSSPRSRSGRPCSMYCCARCSLLRRAAGAASAGRSARSSRTVFHGKSAKCWNTMPRSGPGRGHRRAFDADRALLDRQEAADQVEERRLAAARRPEQRDELALPDRERNVVQRQHVAAARRPVGVRHILDADHLTGIALESNMNMFIIS